MTSVVVADFKHRFSLGYIKERLLIHNQVTQCFDLQKEMTRHKLTRLNGCTPGSGFLSNLFAQNRRIDFQTIQGERI